MLVFTTKMTKMNLQVTHKNMPCYFYFFYYITSSRISIIIISYANVLKSVQIKLKRVVLRISSDTLTN